MPGHLYELDRILDAIHQRTARLDGEPRWRIELSLDVASTHPRGKNPLPPTTWFPLVRSVGKGLIDLERRRIAGSRLATSACLALEGAAAVARGRDDRAQGSLHDAEMMLEELSLEDLVSDPWEVLGATRALDGGADLLDVIGRPSGRVIQPEDPLDP